MASAILSSPAEKPSMVLHKSFNGVQALRGVAAVMVVTFHSTQMWWQHVAGATSTRAWGNGAGGVDIFFVISGFVMSVSWLGREENVHPARSFMMRRWMGRLWPRWSLALGDASYSLYLSHLLVMTVLVKVLVRAHLLAPGAVRMRNEAVVIVACLLCCGLVSVLVYRWVEKPMNLYLRRRFIERRRQSIPA